MDGASEGGDTVGTTGSEPAASAADTAREALRGLAHATRAIDEPGDSYAVLGSLHAGLASLRQTIDQLASFHERHARLATTPRELGHQVAAEVAAVELREATAGIEQAYSRVAAAWSHNGRIVWHREPPEPVAAARRLADLSAYGTPSAADVNGGLAR